MKNAKQGTTPAYAAHAFNDRKEIGPVRDPGTCRLCGEPVPLREGPGRPAAFCCERHRHEWARVDAYYRREVASWEMELEDAEGVLERWRPARYGSQIAIDNERSQRQNRVSTARGMLLPTLDRRRIRSQVLRRNTNKPPPTCP